VKPSACQGKMTLIECDDQSHTNTVTDFVMRLRKNKGLFAIALDSAHDQHL